MNTNNICHLEVTLYNTSAEYGITLSGGSDHKTPLYIAKVKRETPAHRSALKKRDIVLSINNYNCIQCKHKTAVTLIKLDPQLVKFVVYRSPQHTYMMNNLFDEMKTYVEHRNLHLGQLLSDHADILENYKVPNTAMFPNSRSSPIENGTNILTNTQDNNSVRKGETTASKISLSSFGSDWYKNYATNTVKAKQNVTVKDMMQQERTKSISARSYLKSSNNDNYNSNNSKSSHKVQALVESFNNQPTHITNNILRKTNPEEDIKYESQYNGMDHNEMTPSDLLFQSHSKYLEQTNSVYEAVATDDYNGKGPCELNVRKGDKLIIFRSIDSNWYEGFIEYPDFKIIPKHIVAIDRIVFVNYNGADLEIKQQLPSN